MNKVFFFLIISLNYSFAQVTEVEYEFYKNLGIPTTENWTLAMNESESYFFLTKDKKKDTLQLNKKSSLQLEGLYGEKQNIELGKDKVISHTIQINAHAFYHLDFQQNSLRFQGNVLEDLYVVNEELPKMNWTLLDEYKNIEKYKCQKATTYFRGRNYIVWFTQEIPVKTGPWKFNGLPGLILSVNDDIGKISIIATSVKTNPEINLQEKISFIEPKGESITIQDFIPLSDNQAEELVKRIRSKFGRTSSSSNFIKASERHSLEKVYEWEEEK